MRWCSDGPSSDRGASVNVSPVAATKRAMRAFELGRGVGPVVGSLLLHGLAVGLVARRMQAPPEAPSLAATAAPAAIELELVELRASRVEAHEHEGPRVPERARPATRRRSEVGPPATTLSPGNGERAAATDEPYRVSPFAEPRQTGAERRASLDLPWSAPPAHTDDGASERASDGAAPGPRAAPEGDGLRRALARERSDHDRGVGLGPGSAVADVALGAARSAQPPDGWAVLDVTLDGRGRTTAVTLRESSVAGFAAVADAVRAALGARTVSMSPHARGARVRLKVTARFALPNGQKHVVELVKPFAGAGEPGKRSEEPPLPPHATWWRALGPKADSRVLREGPAEVAGLRVDEGLKLPLLAFDPSNLGAKRSLQVGVVVMDVVPL